MAAGTSKSFYGIRRDSLPAAINWAVTAFCHEYVSSPHGGYIPKHVLFKALRAEAGKEPANGKA